jgi:hypothetical protein
MALLIIPFVASSTEQSFKETNIRGIIFEAEATEFIFSLKQSSNVINSYGQYAELLAVEGRAHFPCGLSGPRF